LYIFEKLFHLLVYLMKLHLEKTFNILNFILHFLYQKTV